MGEFELSPWWTIWQVASCAGAFPPLQVCAGCLRFGLQSKGPAILPAPDRYGGCELWLGPGDPSMGLPW